MGVGGGDRGERMKARATFPAPVGITLERSTMNVPSAIDFKTYRALEGVNSHYLMDIIQRSPAHAKWNLTNNEDSPALTFGRAFHAAVLEPVKLLEDFAVLPDDLDRRTKAGKEEYAALAATGKTLLKSDDMRRIEAMSVAIRAHEAARMLLGAALHVECSIAWERDGLKCKARLDALSTDFVADIKTTVDASPRAFERSIYQYGYHIQAAWYMAAARAARFKFQNYFIIAIESAQPHGVAVYEIDQGYLETAERMIEGAIETHKKCVAAGVW